MTSPSFTLLMQPPGGEVIDWNVPLAPWFAPAATVGWQINPADVAEARVWWTSIEVPNLHLPPDAVDEDFFISVPANWPDPPWGGGWGAGAPIPGHVFLVSNLYLTVALYTPTQWAALLARWPVTPPSLPGVFPFVSNLGWPRTDDNGTPGPAPWTTALPPGVSSPAWPHVAFGSRFPRSQAEAAPILGLTVVAGVTNRTADGGNLVDPSYLPDLGALSAPSPSADAEHAYINPAAPPSGGWPYGVAELQATVGQTAAVPRERA